MPGDDVTLEEVYAEMDKRIAAAIKKLLDETLEPRLKAIETAAAELAKKLPAEPKKFSAIKR